jgi:hypothetical protein
MRANTVSRNTESGLSCLTSTPSMLRHALPSERESAATKPDGREAPGGVPGWVWAGSPLGLDAGDANLYRYVRNRPTVATDPTGLTPTPPRPEPPLEKTPVPRGFEDPEVSRLIVRLFLKTIELCDRQSAFRRPNALQKELIEINKTQVANLQNLIRERKKYVAEKNPNKKMEHKINLDTLERRQKQLDDRERELKKALGIE